MPQPDLRDVLLKVAAALETFSRHIERQERAERAKETAPAPPGQSENPDALPGEAPSSNASVMFHMMREWMRDNPAKPAFETHPANYYIDNFRPDEGRLVGWGQSSRSRERAGNRGNPSMPGVPTPTFDPAPIGTPEPPPAPCPARPESSRPEPPKFEPPRPPSPQEPPKAAPERPVPELPDPSSWAVKRVGKRWGITDPSGSVVGGDYARRASADDALEVLRQAFRAFAPPKPPPAPVASSSPPKANEPIDVEVRVVSPPPPSPPTPPSAPPPPGEDVFDPFDRAFGIKRSSTGMKGAFGWNHRGEPPTPPTTPPPPAPPGPPATTSSPSPSQPPPGPPAKPPSDNLPVLWKPPLPAPTVNPLLIPRYINPPPVPAVPTAPSPTGGQTPIPGANAGGGGLPPPSPPGPPAPPRPGGPGGLPPINVFTTIGQSIADGLMRKQNILTLPIRTLMNTVISQGLGRIISTGTLGAGLAFEAFKAAEFAREQAEARNESNRRFVPWNGAIAGAFYRLDVNQSLRTFDVARQTQETAVSLVHAVDRMRDSWKDFDIFRGNASNLLGRFFAEASGAAGSGLSGVARNLDWATRKVAGPDGDNFAAAGRAAGGMFTLQSGPFAGAAAGVGGPTGLINWLAGQVGQQILGGGGNAKQPSPGYWEGFIANEIGGQQPFLTPRRRAPAPPGRP